MNKILLLSSVALKITNLLLDTDDTDGDLDLLDLGVDTGGGDDARLRGAVGCEVAALNLASISISRLSVSTGLALPNIDDGSASGIFGSKGLVHGWISNFGRDFDSSIKDKNFNVETSKILLKRLANVT